MVYCTADKEQIFPYFRFVFGRRREIVCLLSGSLSPLTDDVIIARFSFLLARKWGCVRLLGFLFLFYLLLLLLVE